MADMNDLDHKGWFELCREIYRALRQDDMDKAEDLLEEYGFSFEDID